LKKIAADEYKIKIMNEQIKIQPKNYIIYVNTVKELKSKNTKFQTIKTGVLESSNIFTP